MHYLQWAYQSPYLKMCEFHMAMNLKYTREGDIGVLPE